MKGGALFHRDPGHDYPVMARGEGIYLYDETGRRFLDGISGAGNVTLGHGREDLARVLADQARTLAYCFSAFFTNRPAIDLAERIAGVAPGDLDRVYLVSGGSEAMESALKLARQYHLLRGKGSKHKVISRWRSYHGASLGALAVTGMPALRAPFSPWLPDFPKIPACYPYRCPLAGCGGQCNLACARQLEEAIRQAGPDTVAAFVAEPVVMAGVAAGAPPPGYFAEVRAICDEHDVLFIADEIITGFGRTGRWFAIEHWDAVPDLIAFGKGVSSGYAPLGGVVMRGEIAAAFAEAGSTFAHIFTYVDNPVAARVGLEVLDIVAEEGILAHAAAMGDHLQERSAELLRHPAVGQVRGKGLMLGIELVQERSSRKPFPRSAKVAERLRDLCFEQGLAVSAVGGCADWVDGDDLRFYPPLVITREQVDEALGIIDLALERL